MSMRWGSNGRCKRMAPTWLEASAGRAQPPASTAAKECATALRRVGFGARTPERPARRQPVAESPQGTSPAAAPPPRAVGRRVTTQPTPAGWPKAEERSTAEWLDAKGVKRSCPVFETNAERRHAGQQKKARELVAEMPDSVLFDAMGGSAAAAQVAPAESMRLFAGLLALKGGPTGAKLGKALRTWRLHVATAEARGLPNFGLPATAALCAQVVTAEMDRARREGNAPKMTVGKSIKEGYDALAEVVGLPVDSKNALVEAAAEPSVADKLLMSESPTSQAGSMPLKLQLQLEELASAADWSVARTIARAFLAACVVHHIRLNDALNACLHLDEVDPERVVRGHTILKSKKPKRVELYAPAHGFLGPFTWLAEHLAEMRGRKHAVPDFDGRQVDGATALRPGVISPERARAAFKRLMSMAPLKMSAAEFDALHITTHSPHTSGPDMARVFGARHLPASWPFTEEDVRELGHWLRDRSGKVADAADQSLARKGAPSLRQAMSRLYTSGNGRRGEREAQLEVRSRMVVLVRDAIAAFDGHWTTLPPGRDDWDVVMATE